MKKKILSVVMVFVMVFSFGITAHADWTGSGPGFKERHDVELPIECCND